MSPQINADFDTASTSSVISDTQNVFRREPRFVKHTPDFHNTRTSNQQDKWNAPTRFIEPPMATESYNVPHKSVDGPVFSIISAGFQQGNYAEFKFGSKVFLPRSLSRRGLSVLCLTADHSAFHAWNFDFYPNITRNATNRNFINLLRGLPGGIFFALSIKDDCHRNLFEATKNFLARVVGLKTIWRLEYRDSWCAVIYKKTPSQFEVMAESHNPNGVAHVEVPIPTRSRQAPTTPSQAVSQPPQQFNHSAAPTQPVTPLRNIPPSGPFNDRRADVPHLDPSVERSAPNTPRPRERVVDQPEIEKRRERYLPPVVRNMPVAAQAPQVPTVPVHTPQLVEVDSSPSVPVSVPVPVHTPAPAPVPKPQIKEVIKEIIREVPAKQVYSKEDIKAIKELTVLIPTIKDQHAALRDIRKEIERMKVHMKEQISLVKKILASVTKK
jgi:hypothetical protein